MWGERYMLVSTTIDQVIHAYYLVSTGRACGQDSIRHLPAGTQCTADLYNEKSAIVPSFGCLLAHVLRRLGTPKGLHGTSV